MFGEFVKYCLDFYGKGGIYDMGATVDQITSATDKYTSMVHHDFYFGRNSAIITNMYYSFRTQKYNFYVWRYIGEFSNNHSAITGYLHNFFT